MALLTAVAVFAGGACAIGPHRDARDTRFATITEGTNFAVAASPDGRTLVIDLLGALWSVPATGGRARRLTEDWLVEARQPSFSPRGDEIVFQGFDENGWDIWSMRIDGGAMTRLTTGPFDDREPHWSHDGTRIAFASDRSGSYDIWILDLADKRLTRLTDNAAEDFAPAWSPDDREIAFVSTRQEGAGVWAIGVQNHVERRIAAVRGSVSGPSWTPDGQRVLYTVIADGAARLELSGAPVGQGEDVFPFRAQWLSPTEFLYTADGRIKKRQVGAAVPASVDFEASIPLVRTPYLRQRRNLDSKTPRPVRGIVRPAISPDGRRVAFAALGDLWLMAIGSRPVRLTKDRFLDTDPAWSRDGSHLAFSSDRGGKMDLWIRDVATGRERQLTDLATAAMNPTWSPDGRQIAFVSTGPGYLVDVSAVDVASGTVRTLQKRIPTTSEPTWSADGQTILLGTVERTTERFNDGFNKLLAIPVGGGQARFLPVLPDSAVIDSRIAEGPVWSPDGRRIAFVNGGLLRTVDVDSAGTPTAAPRRITGEIAHAPSWTGDSKRILYLSNDELKIVDVDTGRAERVPLELEWTQAIPSAHLVIHAGRLWSGRGELQLDRDVVVDGNRITSVTAHRAELHTGRVVDASRETVIPGLFDLHSHMYDQYGEALGRLMVAYGITTARDPGSIPYRSQELRESYDAGARVGPRLYTSGNALDGDRTYFPQFYAIRTPAQLDMAMERNRRLGDEWFKLYIRLPDALQRRAVEFAHRSGMALASHDIFPALTFGLDGVEHVGGGNRRGFQKVSAIGNTYGDVIQMLIQSGAAFTPTLSDDMSMGFDLVALENGALLDDERMRLLMPAWALAAARGRVDRLRASGPSLRAQTLARHGRMVTTLVRAGVVVGTGTDAPNIPQGLGIHTELALYVRGGLTPLEALTAATIGSARVLGAEGDLGSIEPGKIADLVVVDGDPLADVGNARNVRMMIRNGEVLPREALLSGTAQRDGGK